MPLQRRIPKFGFKNINRREFQGVNLDVIQNLIEKDLADQASHLARVARLVENDPAFKTVRDDSFLWERATAADAPRTGNGAPATQRGARLVTERPGRAESKFE